MGVDDFGDTQLLGQREHHGDGTMAVGLQAILRGRALLPSAQDIISFAQIGEVDGFYLSVHPS